MKKEHSEAWFAKWEQRIKEPIENTRRYHMRRGWLMAATLPTIILLPLAIKGIKELIRVRNLLNAYHCLMNDVLTNGRTITNDGAPGAGKTFTGSNMAYFLAQRQWAELQSEYLLQKSMLAEWAKNGETDKLSAFKDLEDAYIFFKERERDYIPCLISSIPLREYGTGRMSYVLEDEMFFQLKRCAEKSVFFCDEIGKDSGADKSKTDDDRILEFWRFPRHFFDGMFITTNQDGAQNGIFVRRSTDYVNHIEGQEHLMPPTSLQYKLYKRTNKLFYKIMSGKISEERAQYKAQELYYLKKYAATIGFRRVKHRLTTTKGEPVGETNTYIFPAIGGVEYNDRCFRKLYRCREQELDLKGWDKMIVEPRTSGLFDDLIKASD